MITLKYASVLAYKEVSYSGKDYADSSAEIVTSKFIIRIKLSTRTEGIVDRFGAKLTVWTPERLKSSDNCAGQRSLQSATVIVHAILQINYRIYFRLDNTVKVIHGSALCE